MIQSHELPQGMVEVNGVRKYRINVEEVVTEESTYYTYEEVEFSASIPVEITDTKMVKLKEKLSYEKTKEKKLSALDSLTVEVNGVVYDANQEAINNMASVVGVAHNKYNQAIAQGVSADVAYENVYKTTIEWKGADNLPHTVQIESVVEALEQAMQKRAEIYGV